MSSFGQIRPVDTQPNDDGRTPYEVDADRILYSAEFRRLAGVTQVIPPQEDYVFHDRLTHTLKVAQVAQRLASYVIRNYTSVRGIDPIDVPVDPQVCYVAALIHDLGHPPFGHGAESVLQEILETSLSVGSVTSRPILSDSFEGNAQSFRTVAVLSLRKATDEPLGLNLTWRSLAAASKYPWLRGEHPVAVPKLSKKWGFYGSEKIFLDHLRSGHLPLPGSAGQPRCIEAEIMDFADDISYAVHDLEDFFKSGRTPLNYLTYFRRDMSTEWSDLFDYACGKIGKLIPELNVGRHPDDQIDTDFLRVECERVFDEVILYYIPKVEFQGTRESHANVQSFASGMIDVLQAGCSLKGDNPDDLRFEVTLEARIIAEFLKALTAFYVIENPLIHTMQHGQRAAVREIFSYLHSTAVKVFVDGKANESVLPARLNEYANLCLGADLDDGGGYRNDEARLARATVDFMCSLTDRQARIIHERIVGDSPTTLSPYAFKL
ncbi:MULTISPECIES: deoxyguanosinetriphosphate triphosphohydrolase family protein [Mycobacteriaceae]|uniref:deoxyguanosinetriphosphate triphosphohydrolase family protein n=1 Tax=Mycobacteriaceae TaxID=1762 RepID=UPI00096E7B71|nr:MULTISPECIES: dNTP triphosphohydrolase [Mycobacteriaceae]